MHTNLPVGREIIPFNHPKRERESGQGAGGRGQELQESGVGSSEANGLFSKLESELERELRNPPKSSRALARGVLLAPGSWLLAPGFG